jgi:hypothetical protein
VPTFPPDDAFLMAAFLRDHSWWSAYWDKRHAVWRVAEDDPDSGPYAEGRDLDQVLGYMRARS